MTNEEAANKFLDFVARNYDKLKDKYQRYAASNSLGGDHDTFADAYLKVYDTIMKKGIADTSDKGLDDYLFISLRNALRCQFRYARNKQRDWNITPTELGKLHEDYANAQGDATSKITKDLWIDYATIYVILAAKQQFDDEHMQVFKKKALGNLTFKQLIESTTVKSARKKYLEVQHWLMDNITKEDVKRAFHEDFGELVE